MCRDCVGVFDLIHFCGNPLVSLITIGGYIKMINMTVQLPAGQLNQYLRSYSMPFRQVMPSQVDGRRVPASRPSILSRSIGLEPSF